MGIDDPIVIGRIVISHDLRRPTNVDRGPGCTYIHSKKCLPLPDSLVEHRPTGFLGGRIPPTKLDHLYLS
jgi:hypothetical protein